MYGTLGDLHQFIKDATGGIRVINELVCNHTSDQHPWFHGRRARAGSAAREFYVWSDTNQRYQDARIIFKDFEVSNWTWDHVAGAYYCTLLLAPADLNFDNPKVKDAVLKRWTSGSNPAWMACASTRSISLRARGTNGENLRRRTNS